MWRAQIYGLSGHITATKIHPESACDTPAATVLQVAFGKTHMTEIVLVCQWLADWYFTKLNTYSTSEMAAFAEQTYFLRRSVRCCDGINLAVTPVSGKQVLAGQGK